MQVYPMVSHRQLRWLGGLRPHVNVMYGFSINSNNISLNRRKANKLLG
jgi:hypothetical protein